MRGAVRAGTASSACLLNYRKDGLAFWNHACMHPILDQDGRPAPLVTRPRARGEERFDSAGRTAAADARAAARACSYCANLFPLRAHGTGRQWAGWSCWLARERESAYRPQGGRPAAAAQAGLGWCRAGGGAGAAGCPLMSGFESGAASCRTLPQACPGCLASRVRRVWGVVFGVCRCVVWVSAHYDATRFIDRGADLLMGQASARPVPQATARRISNPPGEQARLMGKHRTPVLARLMGQASARPVPQATASRISNPPGEQARLMGRASIAPPCWRASWDGRARAPCTRAWPAPLLHPHIVGSSSARAPCAGPWPAPLLRPHIPPFLPVRRALACPTPPQRSAMARPHPLRRVVSLSPVVGAGGGYGVISVRRRQVGAAA